MYIFVTDIYIAIPRIEVLVLGDTELGLWFSHIQHDTSVYDIVYALQSH